jgi:hypothetical protein
MLLITLALWFTMAVALSQTVPESLVRTPQANLAQSDINASLSGMVKDAVAGAPVVGARILVVNASKMPPGGANIRLNTLTDEKGRYQFTDLPLARYLIVVRSADPLGPNATRIINLNSRGHLGSIDVSLPPMAIISGRVLNDKKEPIPHARVSAISKEYHFGSLVYSVKTVTTSDDTGEYSLSLVETARVYIIRAEIHDPQPVSRVPSDPKLRKPTLSRTYYPNSHAIEAASPLLLRAGERREGVDVQLSPSPTFCLEATLEADGLPAAFEFSLVEQDLNSSDFRLGGTSGANGRIRICGLLPNEYELRAHDLSSGSAPRLGITTVRISDKDVRDIRLEANKGTSLAGTVVWDDGSTDRSISKLSISVEPLSRMYLPGEQTDTECRAPGQFRFSTLLMGDYMVRVEESSLPGVYVKDIFYAGLSIKNKPLHLGKAMAGAELRVVLAQNGGSLSATVVDKDKNPVPDSYVVIMSGDSRTEAELASALTSGQTDQNGAYSSDTLPPGKYYVLASTKPIAPTPENINILLRSRLTAAMDVTVGPNAMVQVTLTPTSIN